MVHRRTLFLSAACLALLLLAPAAARADGPITEPPDGIFGEYRARALAWWDEFNRFRMEQGLPSMVWSEKMYIVLVEYAKEIATYDPDADGLPSPAERPTRKARRLHKWSIRFMDNPSLSTKSIYSARESIERFGGVRLIRSIKDANQNAGAVAIVDRKNGTDVYVVEAVSRLDVTEILKTQQAVDMARAILSLSDQAERVKAVKDLATMGDIATIFVTVPLLRDPNPGVAAAALEALGGLHDPCLVEPLVGALAHAHPSVRQGVADKLAKLTGRADFGTDPAKWRKWLDSHKGGVVVDKGGPPPPSALGEDDIEKLVEEFEDEYKDADSMGKVDAIRSIAGVKHKLVAKALVKPLGNKDPMVRKAAAEALQKQGDRGATGALVKALAANAAHPEVQVAVIRALGETRDPRAVPALVKDLHRLETPEPTTARIEALGNIRDKRSIDALIGFAVRFGRGMREYRRPLHEALTTLTGQDFGNDRWAWKGWWDRVKKWFRFPPEKK